MSSTLRITHLLATLQGILLTLSCSFCFSPGLALAFHNESHETVSEKGTGDEELSKQELGEEDKTKGNEESEKEGKQAGQEETESSKESSLSVKLTGTFVALEATPISRQPEEWTKMRIGRVVAHGSQVHQGEVLVELDTKKVDRALAELERDVELGNISVEQAEQSLSLLRKSTPLSLEAAERVEQRATENLKRFLTVDKEARRESLEFLLQNAENYLLYQKEELKQLEQMYEADDLTEETEEIILKRTRDQVATAQHYLNRAKIEHDRGLAVDLPRDQEELETGLQLAVIELERVRTTEPPKLPQAELKLEKARLAQEKLRDRLEQMHRDREAMHIAAPTNGIVYYGQCKNGKWSDASSLADQLRPGGMLKSNQTFMTIVKARPLTIQCVVPEKHLSQVSAGTKAIAIPTAFPDLKLAAEIESVSAIPISAGVFQARIHVELTDDAEAIMPGMACRVEILLAKPSQSGDEQADGDEDGDEDGGEDGDDDGDDEDDEGDDEGGDEGGDDEDDEGDDDEDDDEDNEGDDEGDDDDDGEEDEDDDEDGDES